MSSNFGSEKPEDFSSDLSSEKLESFGSDFSEEYGLGSKWEVAGSFLIIIGLGLLLIWVVIGAVIDFLTMILTAA